MVYREEVTNLTIVNVLVSDGRPYCYRSVSLTHLFFSLLLRSFVFKRNKEKQKTWISREQTHFWNTIMYIKITRVFNWNQEKRHVHLGGSERFSVSTSKVLGVFFVFFFTENRFIVECLSLIFYHLNIIHFLSTLWR